MRKLIAIILSIIFVMGMCVGCAALEASEENGPISSFTSIGYISVSGTTRAILYVDINTNIAYALNSYIGSPYLAPNGMPYRYDENSNTLIPIPAWEGQEIPDEWVIYVG